MAQTIITKCVKFTSYNKTVRLWMTILNTLAKKLTAASCVMQTSSDELGTPVSDSVKYKQTKVNTKYVKFLSLCRSLNWLSSKLSV